MRRYTDTFAADGDSSIYQCIAPDNAQVEPVAFTLTGTWNSVTATLYVCADTTASPLVFAAVPSAAYTADTGDKWDMPTGCYFKVTVSASGSPVPALTLNLAGDIKPA
jgi:hypothetical protein